MDMIRVGGLLLQLLHIAVRLRMAVAKSAVGVCCGSSLCMHGRHRCEQHMIRGGGLLLQLVGYRGATLNCCG